VRRAVIVLRIVRLYKCGRCHEREPKQNDPTEHGAWVARHTERLANHQFVHNSNQSLHREHRIVLSHFNHSKEIRLHSVISVQGDRIVCAEVTFNDWVEESCLDCIGCGYTVRSNNGLVQNRSNCVYSNGLDEVTLRIDFITAFVWKLHVPRCGYLQRSHKNSQIYIDAKHEYERGSHACEMWGSHSGNCRLACDAG